MTPRAALIPKMLLGGWAAWVVGSYILRPIPFPELLASAFRLPPGADPRLIPFLSFWGTTALRVSAALILLGVFHDTGRHLRTILIPAPRDPRIRIPLETGLGAIVWSSLFLALALTRLWYPFLLIGILASACLPILPRAKSLRHLKDLLPRDHPWLVATGLIFLLFSLLHAALPEIYADSLVYHLGFLSHWLSGHGWTDMPTHSLITLPFAGEMLYLPGIVLGSPEVSKFIHVGLVALLAVFASGWAEEWGGPGCGVWAFTWVLTLPMLVLNSWTTQVEGIQAFFVLLFLYGLVKSRESTNHRSWAWITGLAAGMAFGVKYTSVPFLLSAGAAGLLFLPRRRVHSPDKTPAFLPVIGSGILLVAGPWLIRNLVVRGNPIAPYLRTFWGPEGDPFYDRALVAASRFYPDAENTPFWSWPWRWAMDPPSLFNFPGPLFLAVLPLLTILDWRNPRYRFLGTSMLLSFVFGTSLSPVSRFLIPAFLMVLLLGAMGSLRWARLMNPRWMPTLTIAASIVSFSYLAGLSGHYFKGALLWGGAGTVEAYLKDTLPPGTQALNAWVRRNLPRDAVLLLAGDSRGYYYRRRFLARMYVDPFPYLRAFREGVPLNHTLRKLGVTHVVVDGINGRGSEAEASAEDRLRPQEWARLAREARAQWELLVRKGDQAVYRLRASPTVPMPEADIQPLLSLAASDIR